MASTEHLEDEQVTRDGAQWYATGPGDRLWVIKWFSVSGNVTAMTFPRALVVGHRATAADLDSAREAAAQMAALIAAGNKVTMTITITRKDNYRPDGGHHHFVYSYTPSEDLSLNGKHVYPAAVPVEYGTSLTELRAMLRRKAPGAEIVEAWK